MVLFLSISSLEERENWKMEELLPSKVISIHFKARICSTLVALILKEEKISGKQILL